MKIAIATTQVPFLWGGADVHARSLRDNLRRRGYEADIVALPFKSHPARTLLEAMLMGRLMDLTEVGVERIDMVIALKFPAYFTPHERKVVWLQHQHRQAYDLWGSEWGDMHRWPEGEAVRRTVRENDNRFLTEARSIFTISRNVGERLKRFNGLPSAVLYPPPERHEEFHCRAFEPFLFYPSRITSIKRQGLLVEAAALLGSDMRVVIAGTGLACEVEALAHEVRRRGLEKRVTLTGFLSDEEKIDHYARASAVFFGGHDEDYGYVPLEAMFSRKPVIVLDDTGGALEFVRDGVNGYVVPPDAGVLAQRIDELREAPETGRLMGEAGRQMVADRGIGWDHAVRALVEAARG